MPSTSEPPSATGGQEQGTAVMVEGQQGQEDIISKGSEEKTPVPEEQKEETEVAAASTGQDTQQPEGEEEKGEREKNEEQGGVATEEEQEMDTTSADANPACPEGETFILAYSKFTILSVIIGASEEAPVSMATVEGSSEETKVTTLGMTL